MYDNRNISNMDGNVLLRIQNFSDEDEIGYGWSYDGRYFYIDFFDHPGAGPGIWTPPQPLIGIARVQVPEEYWVTQDP